MIVALINFSGNVGKTTLAKHLLSPRLDCDIYSIESINADGDEAHILKGNEFVKIQDELLVAENLVIDVGASNVEEFLAMMEKFNGADADIDCFLIPTVPAKKQQTDTASTIRTLIDIGVPVDKLRVLFNQVGQKEDHTQIFSTLIDYCDVNGVEFGSKVVRENELYDMLKVGNVSIDDLLSDKTDYKAKIAATDDRAEKLVSARVIARQRLASGVKAELDAVFESVLAESIVAE